MKKYNHIIWKLLAFIIIIFPSMFLVSCEDEIDDSLPPVIEKVRLTDPETADQAIETAGLGQIIVIVGRNFHNLQEVHINGMLTRFNPTLATDTHIIIAVDDDTPTLATDPDVPNNVTVVTKAGQASAELVVLPPPPRINSISNEFAQAGETLTIKGLYFFFVEEVIFPGEIISTEFETSANGRELYVVVPEGIEDAGSVVVVTESGSVDSAPRWRFNDKTGMFCNFQDINPFGAWGDKPVLGYSDPDPIEEGGAYVRVHETNIPTEMWWDNNMVIPTDGVNWPEPTSDNPADYAIKFEFYTVTPWNSGWFEVNLGWTYFFKLMPWNTPEDPAKYWLVDPDSRINFNTNGWQTYIIPMNRFRLKPGNEPDGDVIPSMGEFDWIGGMVMAFQNPDPPRGLTINELHLLFDNFRLVRIVD